MKKTSKTVTTIKLDKDVWSKVRQKAWNERLKVSEALEKILKEYFEPKEASK